MATSFQLRLLLCSGLVLGACGVEPTFDEEVTDGDDEEQPEDDGEDGEDHEEGSHDEDHEPDAGKKAPSKKKDASVPDAGKKKDAGTPSTAKDGGHAAHDGGVPRDGVDLGGGTSPADHLDGGAHPGAAGGSTTGAPTAGPGITGTQRGDQGSSMGTEGPSGSSTTAPLSPAGTTDPSAGVGVQVPCGEPTHSGDAHPAEPAATGTPAAATPATATPVPATPAPATPAPATPAAASPAPATTTPTVSPATPAPHDAHPPAAAGPTVAAPTRDPAPAASPAAPVATRDICDDLTWESFGKAYFTDYCAECHTATGIAATWPLTSLSEVSALKPRVEARAVQAIPSAMPPAYAKGAPPTEARKQQLAQWLKCNPLD